jgi:sugar phosphate permease
VGGGDRGVESRVTTGVTEQPEIVDATGREGRWRILAAALAVQTTVSMVTQSFPVLAPFAREGLRLTTPEVGVFATVLSVGTMLALLPTGWAVDRLGERWVLVGGGIATGVMAVVVAGAPGFVSVVPLLIVLGVAAASPTPAGGTAIISAFAVRDRGFVMSIRQTGVPLGGALAALLLPPIAEGLGWRWALEVSGGLAIGGAPLGAALMRRGRTPPAPPRGCPSRE